MQAGKAVRGGALVLWCFVGFWAALAADSAEGAAPSLDWNLALSRTGGGVESYAAAHTDPSGNTYIVYEDGTADFRLLVFDSAGNQTSDVDLEDQGAVLTSVTVDSSGYLIAGGYVLGATQDLYTACFDVATGARIWSKIYDAGFDEFPGSVTVDAADNVLQSGWGFTLSSFSSDLQVVKYDAAGTFQWSAEVDAFGSTDTAYAVAADVSGTVYLCGSADFFGTLYPALIKFSGGGTVLGTEVYAGLPDFEARAAAYDTASDSVFLATDDLFNVALLRVDPADITNVLGFGIEISATAVHVTGDIAVTPGGTVYVASMTWDLVTPGATFDLKLHRYDSALNHDGSDFYGTDGNDGLGGLNLYGTVHAGLDASGGVYFTGTLDPGAPCSRPADVMLRKHDLVLSEQWTRMYDAGPDLFLRGMALDGATDAYVSGTASFVPFATKRDGATGALQWEVEPSVTGHCPTFAYGMAAGGGAVYQSLAVQDEVSGESRAAVVSYDAAGSQTGEFVFGAIPGIGGGPIAADASGDVFLAAWYSSTTTFQDDLVVARFTPAGANVWTQTATFGPFDDPNDVALDGAGDLVVLVTPGDPDTNDGIVLAKFDGATGAILWSRTYAAPAGKRRLGQGVAARGVTIYVAGLDDDAGVPEARGRLLQVDATGNIVWSKSYDAGGQDVSFIDVATDLAGNAVVTGAVGSAAANAFDVLVASFDYWGNERWMTSIDSGSDSDIGVDAALGSVFVSAETAGEARTMKYPAAAALDVQLSLLPTTVIPGQTVTAAFSVSNTGTADAIVLPDGWAFQGAANFITVSGPLPAGPLAVAPGMTAFFGWTLSMTAVGTVGLSATATGLDAHSGSPLVAGDHRSFSVVPWTPLRSSLSVTPAAPAVYEPASVVLTVTNTGVGDVTGFSATLYAVTGGALVTPTGSPPGSPVTIAAGASAAFTWTFDVAGSGTWTLTGSGFGTHVPSSMTVGTASSASLALLAPKTVSLSPALALSATALLVGQALDVDLAVTNAGNGAASLTPALGFPGGGGLLSVVSGPAPPGPVQLSAFSATAFAWTLSVTGGGWIDLSATASGTEAGSGAPVSATASARVAVIDPRALQAVVRVSPAAPVAYQPVTVEVTVSNTGIGTVRDLTHAWFTVTGSGLVLPVSAPAPVTVSLPPGTATTFVWRYDVLSAGTWSFTVSGAGADRFTGTVMRYEASSSLGLSPAARLEASASLSSTSAYQWTTVGVFLSVTNTGQRPAQALIPRADAALAPIGGAWRVGPPQPASVASLGPGAGAVFTWSYRVTVTGNLDFTVSVGGIEGVSGLPLVASGSALSLLVLPGFNYEGWVEAVPPSVGAGEAFQLVLTVSNTGAAPGWLSSADLSLLVDPAQARIDAGPVPVSATIAAQSGTRFVWTLTPLNRAGGALVVGVAVSASPFTMLGSGDATVAVIAKPEGEIAIYPNPPAGDRVNVYLDLDADAREITIDAYDAGYRRVFTASWANVGRLDGSVEIVGLAKWAPGIYLLRVRAELADGSTQEFPVGKLVVR